MIGKSILTIYLKLKLKWVRIGVVIMQYFKSLKAYPHFVLHLNFKIFIIRFTNSIIISKK